MAVGVVHEASILRDPADGRAPQDEVVSGWDATFMPNRPHAEVRALASLEARRFPDGRIGR